MGVDVSAMSLWEVNAYWAGYLQAQGTEMATVMSDEDIDEIGRWLDS